ncbi:MAG: GFA family protein [Pseudomonadota bacterium]
MVKLQGSCHCKAVTFEVETEGGLKDVSHCDCSLCRRKTAYVATASVDALVVTKGAEHLSLYQWNTKTAKHYFCKICGIYTHHQRRSNPNEFGFNIGCIEGVNPFDYAPAPVHDGVNHPSDETNS